MCYIYKLRTYVLYGLREMKTISFPQLFASAFFVVGAIVLSAVVFNYSGSIRLMFTPEGMRLEIDGSKQLPPSSYQSKK
jgi:hypothetical protein